MPVGWVMKMPRALSGALTMSSTLSRVAYLYFWYPFWPSRSFLGFGISACASARSLMSSAIGVS